MNCKNLRTYFWEARLNGLTHLHNNDTEFCVHVWYVPVAAWTVYTEKQGAGTGAVGNATGQMFKQLQSSSDANLWPT